MIGRFVVKNKTFGVENVTKFEDRLENAWHSGTFICYETDSGDSEICFINPKGEITPEFCTTVFGDVVPGKPLFYENFAYGNKRDLTILTDKGPEFGVVYNFKRNVYLRDPIESFGSEGLSDANDVSAFTMGVNGRMWVIVDGRSYYSSAWIYGNIKPYLSLDVFGAENIDHLGIATRGGKTLLHSSEGMVYIGSGSMARMRFNENEEVSLPGKCLYIGDEPSNLSGSGQKHLFIEKDGVIKDHVIRYEKNEDGVIIYNPAGSFDFKYASLLDENTMWRVSRNERYFYFTSGNAIYRYDYDRPEMAPTLFYEWPAGIQISYFETYTTENYDKGDLRLEVGVYDSSNSGSLFLFDKDATILDEKADLCGRIVGIETK